MPEITCMLVNMSPLDPKTGKSSNIDMGASRGNDWEDVKEEGTSIPPSPDGIEIGKLQVVWGKGAPGWLDFFGEGHKKRYQLFLEPPGDPNTGVWKGQIGPYGGNSNPQHPMPGGHGPRWGLVHVVNDFTGPVLCFVGDFGEGHGSDNETKEKGKPDAT